MDIISPLELRVAELMHRMKIEAAVAEGAKNVVRQLSDRRIQERRVLSEVTVLNEPYCERTTTLIEVLLWCPSE